MDVSLEVSSAVVSIDNPIVIGVTAVNTSSSPTRFTTNSCTLVVEVLDASGTSVAYLPQTCTDITVDHVVEPGASIEAAYSFNATVSVAAAQGPPTDVALAPGNYVVVAGISAQLLRVSAQVPVTVVP